MSGVWVGGCLEPYCQAEGCRLRTQNPLGSCKGFPYCPALCGSLPVLLGAACGNFEKGPAAVNRDSFSSRTSEEALSCALWPSRRWAAWAWGLVDGGARAPGLLCAQALLGGVEGAHSGRRACMGGLGADPAQRGEGCLSLSLRRPVSRVRCSPLTSLVAVGQPPPGTAGQPLWR